MYLSNARPPFVTGLLFVAGLCFASVGFATQGLLAQSSAGQATPATQLAMSDALNATQPLLGQVNTAVSSIDLHRWKAPNDVKDTTASDVQSIQKDLNSTLPNLLSQAQAAPGTIAPAFAVYRNIDALYDVLLRVTETATLAGSQSEAERLEQARAQLQSRRSQLGTAILNSSTLQDNDVVRLRTQLAAIPRVAAAPAVPNKIVVDDGPSAKKTVRKKKPAASSASGNAGGSASPQ